MDFLYLELLRQKRALARLLLGGQETAPDKSRTLASQNSGGVPVNASRTSARPASTLSPGGFGWIDPERPSESPDPAPDADALAYGTSLEEIGSLRRGLTRSLSDSDSAVRSPSLMGTSSEKRPGYGPSGGLDSLHASNNAGMSFNLPEGAVVPFVRQASCGGLPAAFSVGDPAGSLRAASFAGTSAGYDAARAVSLAFQRDARRYDGGFLS